MTGLPELHLHLDGSLRRSTLEELARAASATVPADLLFFQGMGLQAALARFGFTLSLLQTPAAVSRVAREICEDAAGDGVSTLELRFAPQLHLARGAAAEEIVDAALEGIAGRAGLILCGLYGEPPSVLERLVQIALPRQGVVAIDLAGGPASGHTFTLETYAPAFRRARDAGLGRTVHAGEGRPVAEIRLAIEALGAQRIGHGTTLLDDPATVDLVLEREVTLEACLTSNVHTGAIPAVDRHPLVEWLRRGVRATLCSDNTLLSDTTTRAEVEQARGLPGMTADLLARAVESGHRAAFRRS